MRCLQPSRTNPLVAIRLYFEVGSVLDPKGKEGLAALTAAMLAQGGSRARSYAEVLDVLYPLAAGLQHYGDKESVVFFGTVHRDNLERYAELLADQITQPRLAEEDFQRNRQDALDSITKSLRGNDDEALGKAALGSVLYRDHPYGHPAQGTEAGLARITLDDVKDFYRQEFTRGPAHRRGWRAGIPGTFPAASCERLARAARAARPLPPCLPPPRADRGRGAAGGEGRRRHRHLHGPSPPRSRGPTPTSIRSRSPDRTWASIAPSTGS